MLKDENDMIYAIAQKGDQIGLTDLFSKQKAQESSPVTPIEPVRHCSVKILTSFCEFLKIEMDDLNILDEQFPLIFNDFFKNVIERSSQIRRYK